jgi:hypothetical protein
MLKSIALAGLLLAIATLPAQAGPSWNGTWIGNWKGGNGTQIVFADNTFISLYWDGDYVGDADADRSDGGPVVKLKWTGGSAVITRDGPATAHIVITETGKKPVAFPLTRDTN